MREGEKGKHTYHSIVALHTADDFTFVPHFLPVLVRKIWRAFLHPVGGQDLVGAVPTQIVWAIIYLALLGLRLRAKKSKKSAGSEQERGR